VATFVSRTWLRKLEIMKTYHGSGESFQIKIERQLAMASELLWEKVHTQIFIIIIYTTSISSRTWKLEEEEEEK
jgi:hypothetical protein